VYNIQQRLVDIHTFNVGREAVSVLLLHFQNCSNRQLPCLTHNYIQIVYGELPANTFIYVETQFEHVRGGAGNELTTPIDVLARLRLN